jgi:ditrans,polycis-polyprenyl diphosphate synthase
MSKFVDVKLNWFERFAVNVIKSGRVPKHIGIILDGNRRHARERNLKTSEGHSRGANKLMELHSWSRDLGIKEITAFLFSIENFKRDPEEVENLMDLLANKLQEMLDDDEANLSRLGIRINFFGQLDLFPPRVRQLASKLTLMSRNNSNYILNFALGYTSRGEITKAMNSIRRGIQNHQIETSDVSVDLLEKCMYTKNSFDLDLIIRSSGEQRLSDFLLWQVTHAYIKSHPN